MRISSSASWKQSQFGGGNAAARIGIIIGFAILAVVTLGAAGGILAPAAAALGTSTGALAFAIGVTVGSVVAALALPVKPPSFNSSLPRPSEAGFPGSSEGLPIQYVAGTTKVTGIFIWQTNFRSEEIVSQQSGGKGGGSDSVVTGYNYFLTFGYALFLGKGDKIISIWANETKTWGADASETPIESGELVVGRTYYNKGPSTIKTTISGVPNTTVAVNSSFVAEITTYTIPPPPGDGVVVYLNSFLTFGLRYVVLGDPGYQVTYNGITYSVGDTFVATRNSEFTDNFSSFPGGVAIDQSYILDISANVKYRVVGYTSVVYGGVTYVDGECFVTSRSGGYTYTRTGTGAIVKNETFLSSGRYLVYGWTTIQYKGVTYNDGDILSASRAATYDITTVLPDRKALIVDYGAIERSLTTDPDYYADFVYKDESARVYWGYDDQPAPDSTFLPDDYSPDPNLSYPGLCYIVFKDFPMGNSNFVPRLTVEVMRCRDVLDSIKFEADANVPSGKIEEGKYYYVKTGSVTYNSIGYATNEYFLGVSGVTTYTGTARVLQYRYNAPDLSSISVSGPDINPIAVIVDCLLNHKTSYPYPDDSLINADFESAASTIESEGIVLSPYCVNGISKKSFILQILSMVEGVMFQSYGKFRLTLLRPDYLTDITSGNLVPGLTYTNYGYTSVEHPVGSGTLYLSGQSFLASSSTYSTVGSGSVLKIFAIPYSSVLGSLQIQKEFSGEIPTELIFSFPKRDNQYKASFQTERFNWIYEETGFLVPEGISLDFVYTSSVAGKLIYRYLRKKGLNLAAVGFSTPRTLYAADPGDVILMTGIDHPKLSSTSSTVDLFVRVHKIRHSSDSDILTFETLEDTYGYFFSTLASSVTDGNLSSAPLTGLLDFLVHELPYDLSPSSVKLAMIAVRSSSGVLGFKPVYAAGSSGFVYGSSSSSFAILGTLTQGYGITKDHDLTDSLIIDFSGTLSSDITSLISGIQSQSEVNLLSGFYFILVELELMIVIGATLVSGTTYSFKVIRGVHDTIHYPHDSGADAYVFYKTSASLMTSEDLAIIDTNVQYKGVSFNSVTTQSPEGVNGKGITVIGKYKRPFCPNSFKGMSSIRLPTSFYARYQSGEDVLFSWEPRVRGARAWYHNLVQEFTVSSTEYTDSTFQIEIYHGETLVRTLTSTASANGSQITGSNSAIYSWEDIDADYAVSGASPTTVHITAKIWAVGNSSTNAGLLSSNFSTLTVYRYS